MILYLGIYGPFDYASSDNTCTLLNPYLTNGVPIILIRMSPLSFFWGV